MTLKEKALDDVLGRVEKNILPVLDSEQDANGFLGASIAEALPWLISVPSIRTKIPKMVAGMLPSGIPATRRAGGTLGHAAPRRRRRHPQGATCQRKGAGMNPFFFIIANRKAARPKPVAPPLPFRSRTRPAE